MTTKANRCAIYLRVSTTDQTIENQRLELAKLCEGRGWKIAAEYMDEGVSGAKGRDQRPGFKAMMKDASRRKFDRVVAWSIDRLGRSVEHVSAAMNELDTYGVAQFYSKESVDTGTAHGRAMLQMAVVFAELERAMIQERIHAGIARARTQGTKSGKAIGRPRTEVTPKLSAKITKLRKVGMGINKIARELGIGNAIVQSVVTP